MIQDYLRFNKIQSDTRSSMLIRGKSFHFQEGFGIILKLGSVALLSKCNWDISDHSSIWRFMGCIIETIGKTLEVGD